MKRQLLSLALIISGGISTVYAQAPIFFSEYAEGSSNNKYLEIYNPTDSVVSLNSYAFPSVSNAPSIAGEHENWNTFPDSGSSINPGGVYIICHPSADSTILAIANHTHNYLSNGDDGYALAYGTESDHQIIDFIGDFNADPGSGWEVAGVSNATKDHTLVRKFSISQGNSDWTLSAGTNTEDSEWVVFDQNEWSYLGSHLELVIAAGCTDVNATNYCEECTQDDGTCIYPELNLTIAEIQGMQDESPYIGQMVTTTGLVVAKSESTYFLQDGAGSWNGIYVYSTNDSLEVGTQISITAIVGEFSGATQLSDVNSITVLVSEFTNLSTTISAAMLNTEAYEGVLVTIDTLMCTSEVNNYGEAEFSGAADVIISDDMYFDFTPSLGSYYTVTGVVNHSYGNYKINPRNESDITLYIVGCMDSTSTMFNASATLEIDDSCDEIIVVISGCTDSEALNYCAECNEDDGSCEYEVLELTISEIQGMIDSSPYEGQSVSTSGTITAVTSDGYFIQDAIEAWSGIFVYDSVNVVEIGYEIYLDAEVAEYYGMTQLKNVSSFIYLPTLPVGLLLPLTILPPSWIIEEYEGCLVTISGVCSSENNEYGEAMFMVGFEGENFQTNDLIYLYDFEQSIYYEVTGVVEYSFGAYKLCPRSVDDVSATVSVKEIDASTTSIKMINNVLELESTIVGNQEFKIYNILGETLLQGMFDTELSMPMYHLQSATYIVRVGNYSQMVIVQ
tara:strand:- start:504 stop:2702 length:2199 start_codon:yes stop_codon:yes gene_type:complete